MPLTSFHPAVRRWFESRFEGPTAPQREGWPSIRRGEHTLIAAPTGSGKTLAAFLTAIDSLFAQGPELPDETQVLYVSPLKALVNDVQKNLEGPLEEIRDLYSLLPESALPELRVQVRTGDTTPRERELMKRKPPHILVTTPESLYILLTSSGGRGVLAAVRTVIVDEIHALARDKRGSHLALSLERLEMLAGPVQRIGLSATQKPLEDVGRFLTGVGRECRLVDTGHQRELCLAIELPGSPLSSVCSHETWEEIHARMAELILAHKTTLVFVNTRKLAERIAARLTDVLGEGEVTSHHGSLSRELRLDAEDRLRSGKLRALVATASLELGIDVGDIDLTIQIGTTPSIATFLQRVGRSGHALGKIPKGHVFPLTLDELVCAAALLGAVKQGLLDRTPQPGKPLDILAQQTVAACVPGPVGEDELFERFRRAWPYRDLNRDDFEKVVELHGKGRHALLHRDGVGKRLLATKRARLTAVQSGGAIGDTGDYTVVLEPGGSIVGTVNEDFVIESDKGDIFQLGNTSWRILRIESGTVRVADAKGQPPTLPFWLGEAPARTRELSAEIARLRDELGTVDQLVEETGISRAAAQQIHDYVQAGRQALGAVPTQKRVIAERFFDESGGMQLVLHAPFGGRINRAFGLALRKRFCRGFGFELQAAANEEAIVISLGQHHSFALDEIFDYLHPSTARRVLTQACVTAPMFQTRWRWNLGRSLVLERMWNGRRVPFALQRMRADDWLVKAFPQVAACPENLPRGDLEIPMEHPLVGQTIEDCLTEAMDVDGLLELVEGLHDGSIEHLSVDTPEPSAFAHGVLNARPYAFLDDAPLEERRTQAVLTRRSLDAKTADELGALDPEAVDRVRGEAWPEPADAEELHEALLWMGYVTREEASPWQTWLDELSLAGRVVLEAERWFAVEATRDPKEVLRGRMEALGPIESDGDDSCLRQLEAEGVVLRTRLDGREAWCERRLLARIHRYTVDRLRSEIRPVTAAQFLDYLACWQHVDGEHRLEGPRGVQDVVRQLAGFELPSVAWEHRVLPARVRGYRREWLDRLTLTGDVAWGRLWGQGAAPIRTTPLCLVPREDLATWVELAGASPSPRLSAPATQILELLASEGAKFPQELKRDTSLLDSQLELGLGELISRGLVTCDSFSGLRGLTVPPSRRRWPARSAGRWSLFRQLADPDDAPADEAPAEQHVEFVAGRLLARYGILFRRLLTREKQPIPWRDLLRHLRHAELQGKIRGGRFVSGFDGEQYALPEAVSLVRKVRRRGATRTLKVSAADPLNLRGILTPDERVSPLTKQEVEVG